MKKVSKFLSLVLRHRPDKIGIKLDDQGWVRCDDLIKASSNHGVIFDQAMLEELVRTNDKQRFVFSHDGQRIRANQGHSVPVELGLDSVEPPSELFHGTVEKFLEGIRVDGLKKGSRNHVHLSRDIETAEIVGKRRGKPVILSIDAAGMREAGFSFYLSENGVWLTDYVPLNFIKFP